jgi:hypothetical protein
MGTPQLEDASRRLVTWLFVALAAWGVYLGVGAYLYKHDVRRPLIVIGCVAAFLGVWLLLLIGRNRRKPRLPGGPSGAAPKSDDERGRDPGRTDN